MKTGWFIGFTTAFVLLNIVFSVGEMTWVGSEVAPLFVVMNPFEYGPAAWTGALIDVVMFRYTFFEGSWILVRWILLLPISAGFMIGLVITLAQGIMSALGGLFRAVKPM